MTDNNGTIPAPPSGTIVGSNPTLGQAGQAGQAGQIPPPPSGTLVTSSPNAAQPSPSSALPPPPSGTAVGSDPGEQPGFFKTLGTDALGAATGLAKLGYQTGKYAVTDYLTSDDEQAAEQSEQRKHAAWGKFEDDFHAGRYGDAFNTLLQLFNPEYGDPNDPLNQVGQVEWQTSAANKKLAQEAAKKGDIKAAIQHWAGVLPVANHVDQAIEIYSKDRTRQNLAHVVTAALPAFIPAMAKGAGYVADSKMLNGIIEKVPGASETLSKIGDTVTGQAPTDVEIGKTTVPVRKAVAEPTTFNKALEGLADKRALQEFDVTQTQPAARAAIGKLATEDVLQPSIDAAKTVQQEAAVAKLKSYVDKAVSGANTVSLSGTVDMSPGQFVPPEAFEVPSAAQIDQYWDDAVNATGGDFGAVARIMREKLSPLYEKASQTAIEHYDMSWQELRDAADSAFRRGDDVAQKLYRDRMQAAFDEANGSGTFGKFGKMYSKLDAVDHINDVMKSKAVLKPTPAEFLKAGERDLGIIDGKALRSSVLQLENDGTFKAAGVPKPTIDNLQRLGEILEKSKVTPETKPMGLLGRFGQGVKLPVGHALAYLMTHPDVLQEAVDRLKNIQLMPRNAKDLFNPSRSAKIAGLSAIANQYKYDPDSEQVVQGTLDSSYAEPVTPVTPVSAKTEPPVWKQVGLDDLFTIMERHEGDTTRNNPLNLVYAGQPFAEPDPTSNKAIFDTYEHGKEAGMRQLEKWSRKNPNWQIEDLVKKQSPDRGEHGGDNAPGTEAAYARAIRKGIRSISR